MYDLLYKSYILEAAYESSDRKICVHRDGRGKRADRYPQAGAGDV